MPKLYVFDSDMPGDGIGAQLKDFLDDDDLLKLHLD